MSDSRLCQHGMTLEAGCIYCERVTAWKEELEQLRVVAIAAKTLVQSASGGSRALETELVSEPALTALETALAAAGYDMTDEELQERLTSEDDLPAGSRPTDITGCDV